DATRDGIERQIQAIPRPDTNLNNTALYSAIYEALPILRERAASGTPVSLVVFTDGVNDVGHPQDDRGLLGNEGLAMTKARAAEAGVPWTTAGSGRDGAGGRRALGERAWPTADNYYNAATNPNRLQEIFESTRRKLTNRIQMTFRPTETAREQLAAKTLPF